MDEETQDAAIAYVFQRQSPEEARQFAARLSTDPELRILVDELEETGAALALAAPAVAPPPQLRDQVLARIRGQATPPAASPSGARGWNPIAWAIAAGFVITTGALWFERDQWRTEALALRGEAAELRNRDELAQIRIATLGAQVDTFAKTAAVVVWDAKAQRGILRMAHLPIPDVGKDYQLWVIDPKYPSPVSGGVVPVDAQGSARVAFTPDQPVRAADKFAVSIEPKGGSLTAQGQIVFVGE